MWLYSALSDDGLSAKGYRLGRFSQGLRDPLVGRIDHFKRPHRPVSLGMMEIS